MAKALLLQQPASLDLNSKIGQLRTEARLLKDCEILNEAPKAACMEYHTAAHLVGTVPVVVTTFIDEEEIAHGQQ